LNVSLIFDVLYLALKRLATLMEKKAARNNSKGNKMEEAKTSEEAGASSEHNGTMLCSESKVCSILSVNYALIKTALKIFRLINVRRIINYKNEHYIYIKKSWLITSQVK
jgi:hypothetical protein